jgi:hypothetical protein
MSLMLALPVLYPQSLSEYHRIAVDEEAECTSVASSHQLQSGTEGLPTHSSCVVGTGSGTQ